MTNFLFIQGHAGAGSGFLYESLASSPSVAGVRTGIQGQFTAIGHLENMAATASVRKPKARHVLDVLDEDASFVARHLYPCCRFVILVREPAGAFASSVAAGDPSPRTLPSRYCNRLTRLCEIARDSPGCLLVTYEGLADGSALRWLRGELALGHVGNAFRAESIAGLKDSRQLADCRAKYDRCLAYLRRRCLTVTGGEL